MNKNQMLSKKCITLTFFIVAALVLIFVYVASSFGGEQHGDYVETEERNVIMSIQNVTPNGISFTIENTAETEYTFGEAYTLFILKGDSWESVEPVIEDNWGFYAIGYSLAQNAKTDLISVDWTWLYGKLTDGHYKFQKDILECEFFIP